MSNKTSYNNNYDVIFKTVIIGDAGVGKSSLLERYIDESFKIDSSYVSTIGVDFKIKLVKINTHMLTDTNITKKLSLICKLQLWDTAGQERFNAITRSYYRSCNIFVICFDITCAGSNGSMHSVQKWLRDIEDYCSVNRCNNIYIIGTCMDNLTDYELNEFVKNEELKTCIEYWNSFNGLNNVKFMGICSSKNDKFIEFTTEFVVNSMTCMSSDNEINIKNINDMFELITKHYVDNNMHNKDFTVYKQFSDAGKKINIDDIVPNAGWCCTIL
jgi:small GTP-binding protein